MKFDWGFQKDIVESIQPDYFQKIVFFGMLEASGFESVDQISAFLEAVVDRMC